MTNGTDAIKSFVYDQLSIKFGIFRALFVSSFAQVFFLFSLYTELFIVILFVQKELK